MSKRNANIWISFISLGFGFLLYVFCRPTTYIGSTLGGIPFIDTIQKICSLYAGNLFKFYLPDFLWAFALGCGLIAIYVPKRTGVIICAAVSFLCGALWEMLQSVHLLRGTGDILDVAMYFLASMLCIIINLKEI